MHRGAVAPPAVACHEERNRQRELDEAAGDLGEELRQQIGLVRGGRGDDEPGSEWRPPTSSIAGSLGIGGPIDSRRPVSCAASPAQASPPLSSPAHRPRRCRGTHIHRRRVCHQPPLPHGAAGLFPPRCWGHGPPSSPSSARRPPRGRATSASPAGTRRQVGPHAEQEDDAGGDDDEEDIAKTTHATMATVWLAAKADPASKTLFFHSLGWSAGADDLLSTFSRFGFVLFCSRRSVLRALRCSHAEKLRPPLRFGGRGSRCSDHRPPRFAPLGSSTVAAASPAACPAPPVSPSTPSLRVLRRPLRPYSGHHLPLHRALPCRGIERRGSFEDDMWATWAPPFIIITMCD
jgi:hypothetical protein